MKPFNYWRRAKRELNVDYTTLLKRGDAKSLEIARHIQRVSTSIDQCDSKFVLPDNGRIMADGLRGIEGAEIRLPFPEIVIEYQVLYDDDTINKWIIFAFEDLAKKEIICVPIIDTLEAAQMIGYRRFHVGHVGAAIPFVATGAPKGHWSAAPVSFLSSAQGIKVNTAEDIDFFRMLVNPVLELIEALSCKNVDSMRLPHKHTEAKHKALGFDEYRVLTISAGHSSNKRHGNVQQIGGSSVAYREHLRRGHIRRHPTAGNVWVNSCVVNPGSGGKIHKTYMMTA